jgi:hypothetical protein
VVVIPSTSVVVTGPGVVIDLAQGTDRIDQTDQGLEIDPIDLAQGTDQIDQTDLGLEVVLATDLLLEAEIAQVPDLLEVETDPVREPDQVHVQARVQDRAREQDQVHVQVRDKDLVREQDQAHAQAQDKDLVLEQGQVHAQAQVQDRVQEQGQVHAQVQVRDKDQVQWIDQGRDQVRDKVVPEPVVEVPWAATRVGALLPGTVSAVDPAVPANQEPDRQGVLRAEVGVEADQRAAVAVVVAEAEVDVVAEAEVAEADVDADLKWR